MFKKEKASQSIGLMGKVKITVKRADGTLKKLWNENVIGKFLRSIGMEMRIPFLLGSYKNDLQFHNLIVDAGLAGLASRINGSGAEAAFTYLAVGIGTGAAAAGNTTLGTEITDSGLERAAATASRTTTTATNDTAKLSKTWSVTGSKAVTEVGALNAADAGTLLGRQVFSAVNVANGDSLQVDYSFVSANAA